MAGNIAHEILSTSREILDEIIHIRRELHQIPEPGFREFTTSQYLADILGTWDIPIRTCVAGTGVIAFLDRREALPTVVLRADMDALPLAEKTNLPFMSRHAGFFHACGHDMHMACLLGALKILTVMTDMLPANVRAIFQPAEEPLPGGASAVIKEGALTNPDVAAIFGLHVDPSLSTGKIAVRPGPMMASTASFTIHITGSGGHAAKPHSCINPIPVAAQVILALQTVVSRMADPLRPAVITVTMVSAGTAHNIIPEDITLAGSARSLDPETGEALPREMERAIKGIVSAYGAAYDFRYERGTAVLVNDGDMTRHVASVGEELLGSSAVEDYEQTLGGEDFAEYLRHVPGCFFRLGCAREGLESFNLHNPKFNPDENALLYGAAMMAGLVLKFEVPEGGG